MGREGYVERESRGRERYVEREIWVERKQGWRESRGRERYG